MTFLPLINLIRRLRSQARDRSDRSEPGPEAARRPRDCGSCPQQGTDCDRPCERQGS
jgi:hypothetical protein